MQEPYHLGKQSTKSCVVQITPGGHGDLDLADHDLDPADHIPRENIYPEISGSWNTVGKLWAVTAKKCQPVLNCFVGNVDKYFEVRWNTDMQLWNCRANDISVVGGKNFPFHFILRYYYTCNNYLVLYQTNSSIFLIQAGVSGGLVGYPRACQPNQFREFNSHRVHILLETFSCIKKLLERELATFDEDRRAVGMLNSMRDKNWRHVPGGRDDACNHGLSKRSLRVKPPTSWAGK